MRSSRCYRSKLWIAFVLVASLLSPRFTPAGGPACTELDTLRAAYEAAEAALKTHDDAKKALESQPLPTKPGTNKDDLASQRTEVKNAEAKANTARGERTRWTTSADGIAHDDLKRKTESLDEEIKRIRDLEARAAAGKPGEAAQASALEAEIQRLSTTLRTKQHTLNGYINENERGSDGKEERDKQILQLNTDIAALTQTINAKQGELATVRTSLFSKEDAEIVKSRAAKEAELATLNKQYKPLADKYRELSNAVKAANDALTDVRKKIDITKVEAQLQEWDKYEGGATKRKNDLANLDANRAALAQAVTDKKTPYDTKLKAVQDEARDLIADVSRTVDLANIDANINTMKAAVVKDAKQKALALPHVAAKRKELGKALRPDKSNLAEIKRQLVAFAKSDYDRLYLELIAKKRGEETSKFTNERARLSDYDCLPEVIKVRNEIDKAITEKINKQLVSIGGDVDEEAPDMGDVSLDDSPTDGSTVTSNEAKSYKFDCRPGAWTSTGITLTKESSVTIKAEGKLTRGADWSTGPGGYYHLGFQAWTFKAKVGKRLIDIGAGGNIWGEEGELLLAPTYTYDPDPAEGKTQGSITATVTAKGANVDDATASSGGKRVPPTMGGGDGSSSTTPGTQKPGGEFRNVGEKEVIIACPVTVRITDSAARSDREIDGITLESKPDGNGGQVWYASLPRGEYTAHITGTGKGTVHVRTKQRGKPDMTYPPFDVENGSTASLILNDSPEPAPLKTGTTRELSPTAGTSGASGGSTDGIASQISAGKNLKLARWTTFRRITDFPRGEGVHIVTVAKMSADGSHIVFGTHKGLFVMNTNGSDVRTIAQGTPITHVDISADGRKIAWFQRGEKPALFTANADGTDITPMPMNGASILNALRLTADGSRLYVVSFEKAGLYVMPTDGSDLKRVVDTASVCKLLKIDENGNHWRNAMEISDDGSRIVFHFLWQVFGVNGDGSGLHLIADRKGSGINAMSISGDGRTVVVHESSDPEKSGVIFHDFDGREVSRFKTPPQDAWSMFVSPDGGRVFRSPGVNVFSADGKTYYDPCDVGPALWANPMLVGLSRDGSRACLKIDGPESTDQGRPHQFVMVEFNPTRAVASVPNLVGASASPKFMLADGSSNVMATVTSSVAEAARSVGAVLVVNGARPRNIAMWSFAMNDNGGDGDVNKSDGTFTTASVNGRTYDGKPLLTGPITLRLHVLDQGWNLTVADFEGLEVRAP